MLVNADLERSNRDPNYLAHKPSHLDSTLKSKRALPGDVALALTGDYPWTALLKALLKLADSQADVCSHTKPANRLWSASSGR